MVHIRSALCSSCVAPATVLPQSAGVTSAFQPNPVSIVHQMLSVTKSVQSHAQESEARHAARYDTTTEVVLPQSEEPMTPHHPKDKKEGMRMFVSKHKIDNTLPDALSCLEKSLTPEQKELFAFRLQIGDTSRDDVLYNAWRALKQLYRQKDIYSMYDRKPPKCDQLPENFGKFSKVLKDLKCISP